MDLELKKKALVKLAFYGTTWVPGSPTFGRPQLTVGQTMYNLNSQVTNNTCHNSNTNNIFMQQRPSMQFGTPVFSGITRRKMTDDIVGTGVSVNSPAKSLLHAGIGALTGNFIANALKTGPFVRGLMTATGANYGYNH